MFFNAKVTASKEDNPNRHEATIRLFFEKYWKATKTKIATLESMGAWKIVEQYDNINVIQLTWDFKCKLYPEGLINKFRDRFCARGNQQL